MLWLAPALGLIFILISILYSCAPSYALRNRFDSTFTKEQVDSILLVEGLPTDLTKWNGGFLVDENRNIVKQYMYIPKKDTAIYVLTDCDSIYRFKKRVKLKKDK